MQTMAPNLRGRAPSSCGGHGVGRLLGESYAFLELACHARIAASFVLGMLAVSIG